MNLPICNLAPAAASRNPITVVDPLDIGLDDDTVHLVLD